MKTNVIALHTPEIEGLKFIKNFRSTTAEEWYIFIPNFLEPETQGASGKVIIHYDLQGNREVFINTTIILEHPDLHNPELHPLVHAITEELIHRLVGYANTLVSVHAGQNSYNTEYVN